MPEPPLQKDSNSPANDPTDTSGTPPAAPPPPRFTIYDILVGKEGLRAGWGLALFLLFAFLLLTLIRTVTPLLFPHLSHSPLPNGPIPWPITSLSECEGSISVLLATWVMAGFERRPVAAYGYRPQHAARFLVTGLLLGVFCLSLLVFSLRAAGLLVFDTRLLFGRSIFYYAILWLGAFLLVALFEESFARGYLQFTLTRGLAALYRLRADTARANLLGFWTSAAILSFAFAFGHRTNPGESPLGLLSAGLAGFLFCFSLWRTGSLWWAIGFHASWDWAQSFLYGVPDSGIMAQGHLLATHPVGPTYLSGGLTGPEGSLLLLPVMAVATVAVLLTLPRTHSGYKPCERAASSSALNSF